MNNEPKKKFDGIEIGALWKKDGKLSGTFGNGRILILENKFKEEEKHPDFKIFIVPQERREQPQAGAPSRAPHASADQLPRRGPGEGNRPF